MCTCMTTFPPYRVLPRRTCVEVQTHVHLCERAFAEFLIPLRTYGDRTVTRQLWCSPTPGCDSVHEPVSNGSL